MPINIPNDLPAKAVLNSEQVFVMTEERSCHQDIRPLNLLFLNLMPKKINTEIQYMRKLSNTPLQVNITLLRVDDHISKNTPQSHMDNFYKEFEDIKDHRFDGMIVTGAPVENLDFEAVDYWDELHQVLDWSRTHVYSTLHICWGAQAGLYARYGIPKHPLAQKLWGVYHQTVENPKHVLFRGFDDDFVAPHSRSTETYASELPHDFEILSYGETSGLSLVVKKNLREIYSFGHLEYDRMTLDFEYQRDKAEFGEDIVPDAYYPNDDPTQKPKMTWSSAASLFFSNWLNYAVYQDTPYDLRELAKYEYFNL